MKHLLIFLLLINVSFAEQLLLITKSGKYYIAEEVNGILEFKELTKIYKFSSINQDPSPPPNTVNDVSKQVSVWAKALNDPETTQGLSVIYKEGYELFKKDNSNIWQSIKESTDVLLKSTGSEDKWSSFRVSLSSLINDYTQQGKLSSNEQVLDFIKSVYIGLDLSLTTEDKRISENYEKSIKDTFNIILEKLNEN